MRPSASIDSVRHLLHPGLLLCFALGCAQRGSGASIPPKWAPDEAVPRDSAADDETGEAVSSRPDAEVVEVPVIVRRYEPNASWSHYDDGSFETNDCTVLEIEQPHASAGRSISVFHTDAKDDASPWQSVGARFVLVAPKTILEEGSSVQWFSGGLELRDPAETSGP